MKKLFRLFIPVFLMILSTCCKKEAAKIPSSIGKSNAADSINLILSSYSRNLDSYSFVIKIINASSHPISIENPLDWNQIWFVQRLPTGDEIVSKNDEIYQQGSFSGYIIEPGNEIKFEIEGRQSNQGEIIFGKVNQTLLVRNNPLNLSIRAHLRVSDYISGNCSSFFLDSNALTVDYPFKLNEKVEEGERIQEESYDKLQVIPPPK